MITTNGQLYQWDTKRVIEIYPEAGYKVDEVHIYSSDVYPYALVLNAWSVDGKTFAKIPDLLLQFDSNIGIYIVMSNSRGKRTIEHKNVTVKWRAKPENYVFTETEIEGYESPISKDVTATFNLGGEEYDNN